ncbi:MAG TPA: ShlB/FhaC/HecB family hemolysin secretion/activation protein [Steroidobacteraceae bacterium]|nr:ShlB/FhaC/HecB family hemolysin secretion/activation protein [Steroidobacteraceae bacterium]
MHFRRRSHGCIRLLLLAAAACSASSILTIAAAQGVSPPGGVLPITPQSTQPSIPSPAPQLVIPGINERPLGLTEGPKILVKAFRLGGAADLPRYGVRAADAGKILDDAVRAEPAQGYAINQLQAIAGRVADYYHEKGLVLVQAFVPAQTVSDGTILIDVLLGRLEAVNVVGNKHYSTRILLRPFKGLIHQPVDKDDIESALLTTTGYPGVTAFGVLAAGRELGTTDLTLRVQREKRVALDVSMDNEGVAVSGQYRAQVGLTVNDPLGLADQLQLSGMYAFDPSHDTEHGTYGGASYAVPIFSPRDYLTVSYFTNAYVVGGLGADLQLINPKGKASDGELGYRHDFAPSRLGSASLGAAFDVKRATFSASGSELFKDDLSTAHVDFRWNRIDTRFRGINQLQLSYEHGFKSLLGSLGDYDAAAAPHASRQGATGQFNKGTLSLQRLQRISSDVSLLLHVQGQETSDPLLSLEQLSLAGPEAVRAYSVADVLMDKGGIGTAELIVGAPGFANRPAFGDRTWGQELQFSLFADYAAGWLNDYIPGASITPRYVNLGGWGGAIQFNVPGRVFARIDVATPLTARRPGNGRDPQYFFRLGVSL